MNRNYEENLVNIIKYKESVEKFGNLDVLIKPIPDGKYPGQMDPRVYKSKRKGKFLNRFLPKKKFKMQPDEINIEAMRSVFNAVDSFPMVTEQIIIDKETIVTHDHDTINVKIYRKNKEDTNRPILYYIHGGGFFAGRAEVVEEAMRLLVVKFNIHVFSINYRLAPEYPYPLGHMDTYTGLKWVYEHAENYGSNKNNISIAGDSAGGNLAQYCTNQSLKENLTMVKRQILLYPVLNLTPDKDAFYDFNFERFPLYDKHLDVIEIEMNIFKDLAKRVAKVLDIKDLSNPDISPYLEIHPNCPPTLLSVGEFDPLRQETIAYGRKLKSKGVHVEALLYRGMPHAYIDKVGYYPQSEDMVDEIGTFILK